MDKGKNFKIKYNASTLMSMLDSAIYLMLRRYINSNKNDFRIYLDKDASKIICEDYLLEDTVKVYRYKGVEVIIFERDYEDQSIFLIERK